MKTRMRRLSSLKVWSAIIGVALTVALVLTFLPFGIGINTDGLLSISLSQVSANPDWLSGYDQRVKLTVNASDIDSDLTHFPVLLYVSNSTSGENNEDVSFVFDELGSDANRKKIAVTKDDGTTQCHVEIESWNTTSEEAWLWVSNSTWVLDDTVDTDFYLYYDADHTDNTDHVGDPGSIPAETVWDSNFKFVCHMGDKMGMGLSYVTTLANAGKRGSHDVAVSGNYAFLCGYWDDALYVVDITDTENPSLEATLTDGSSRLDGIHDIVIDGNYAYVTCINRNSVVSIDISTPTSPAILDEVIDADKLDYVHALNKDGNYIYAGSLLNQYFTIIDATDPSDMSIVGYLSDSKLDGSRVTYMHTDGYVYVACTVSGYLCVMDVSNKTSPTIHGSVEVSTGISNVKCRGNYAFATSADDTLKVVDISTPSSPSVITDVEVTGPNYLTLYGDYAFVTSAYLDYVSIIDIHDPTNPSLVGNSPTTDLDFPCGMAIVGNYLLVSPRDTYDKILTVLALSEVSTSHVRDSTSNNNDGTKKAANEPAVTTGGKIADAQTFDGADDFIDAVDVTHGDNITVSAWIKPDAASLEGAGKVTYIVAKYGTDAGARDWALVLYEGKPYLLIYQSDDTSVQTYDAGQAALTAGVWYHILGIADGSNVKCYQDNTLVGVQPAYDGTINDSATIVVIGSNAMYQVARWYDGIADEVRYSNTNRVAAWIKATYETQRDDLLDWGSEEGATPEISNTPDTWAIGVIQINDVKYFSADNSQDDDYALITNTGNCDVDIEIQGQDIEGGSYDWTLASSAGSEQYSLYANSEAAPTVYNIEVRSSSYANLCTNLAEDDTYNWSIKFTAPTAFNANEDGEQKSCTVTLVASASS